MILKEPIESFAGEYRQIGARIMYFRKMRRYTQEELAFRASISASYLSRIERGVYKKGLPLSTIMRIAKALDIELSAIFKSEL